MLTLLKLLTVQTCAVVIHWLNSVCLMKTQVSFEIRTYINGRINLNISGSQIYKGSYQIHRTYVVSKMLDFRWHGTFQDGFTKRKDGSRPGQP